MIMISLRKRSWRSKMRNGVKSFSGFMMEICILNTFFWLGRISFYREGRQGKGEAPPSPLCNLNLTLPADISPDHTYTDKDIMEIQVRNFGIRERKIKKRGRVRVFHLYKGISHTQIKLLWRYSFCKSFKTYTKKFFFRNSVFFHHHHHQFKLWNLNKSTLIVLFIETPF